MTAQVVKLIKPRNNFDRENPFNGDLFERRLLANQLTGYIDRLNIGAVLAIDAPWGEGKTWFGENWAADLETKDYPVVFLDAFQQDYIEDPFLLIASEINSLISDADSSGFNLKEKAANVMKAIIPFSSKVILNLGGRIALGSANLNEDIKDTLSSCLDVLAESTQKYIEDKIEDYQAEKDSLESFREALKEFCSSKEKPVVFFIDELDRCRPDFAIKLIERLKHFFDVPNLVFVLLLNRDQLEKAIKGVYGAEVDATAYLGKFIHLYLRLPKKANTTDEYANANFKYIQNLLQQHDFSGRDGAIEGFARVLNFFATSMKMSFRDLERAVTLLALNGTFVNACYLAWPISLKLMHPKIYDGIFNDNVIAHAEAAAVLESLNYTEGASNNIKDYFYVLHMKEAGKESMLSQDLLSRYQSLQPNWTGYQKPLVSWLNRIDLSILN